MQKHKRKKKLINKSLQLKMIGVFTAIGCTCALFQVVLINFGLLEIAQSAESGGEQLLSQARVMMAKNVAWTLGAMIPLMTCIGVVLTHRVAGPAYRMTQYCKGIANGDPVQKCTIRKDDELKELCAALNAAIEHLAPAGSASQSLTEPWQLEDAPSLVAIKSAASAAQEDAQDEAAGSSATVQEAATAGNKKS